MVKFLTTSNQIKYNRKDFSCHSNGQCIYARHFSLAKLRQHYTQILELRKTFFKRFENMTFDHYLTKAKSMLEWKSIWMMKKKS